MTSIVLMQNGEVIRMNDTISREDAIDEVKRLHGVAWENWKETRISANTMIDALKDLPPSDPEIIRCKDCKYRKVNEHYGEKGYMNLKAICELDTGDIFQLGRYAEEDDWFCADAERREGDADAN